MSLNAAHAPLVLNGKTLGGTSRSHCYKKRRIFSRIKKSSRMATLFYFEIFLRVKFERIINNG